MNRDFHFTLSPTFLICCLLSWLLSRGAMLLVLSLMTKEKGVHLWAVGLEGGTLMRRLMYVVRVSGAALRGTCMVKT